MWLVKVESVKGVADLQGVPHALSMGLGNSSFAEHMFGIIIEAISLDLRS
jgi:hypothetical protein